jgi:hypothetical protein
MGSCHPNPQRVSSCPTRSWAHGGCAVDPASLLLAVAVLRLVVVPCLNAHKRHVRDPLYFFNGLLAEGIGVVTSRDWRLFLWRGL